MRRLSWLVGVVAAVGLAGAPAWAAGGRQSAPQNVIEPFEQRQWPASGNQIDELVQAALLSAGIRSANPCSDEVFMRRAYLDVIGTLPEPTEVLGFLNTRRLNKREVLVDALLDRDEFADYWAMKWCDLLRVKAEFPINLWPNAVQCYHRWLRDAVKDNKPYNQFAWELLTSSGSNFRVPPVNFYRAMEGHEPSTIAETVALTFLGTRLASWPEAQQKNLAAFFSRVEFKPTREWKEEIVLLDPTPTDPLQATFPDGTQVTIPAGQDPRFYFANWLLQPGNPWFARAIVNRVWYWLNGRGIVQEPDDFRPDNPPSNPALLDYLANELVSHNYDLKQIFRLILLSRTYQQSSIPRDASPTAEKLFAWYPVRRLDAEVIADALYWLTGEGDTYSSMIPEPFTWIPDQQRTIALADGSITSSFLEMFGRPPRDTGLETERSNQPSDSQRLYLLNASDVQKRLDKSQRLKDLIAGAGKDRAALIAGVYLTVLSRRPVPVELATANAYFDVPGLNQTQAVNDLAWALINTKEFLYRH